MIKSNKFMTAYLQIIKESAEPQDETPAVNNDNVATPADDNTETTPASTNLKQVCFKTSDAVLIDALNSGFEEIVVFTKAKGEDGEDTIVEVKFKPESFGDIEICDVDEDCCPDCGKNPCGCEPKDGEDNKTIDECGDDPAAGDDVE